MVEEKLDKVNSLIDMVKKELPQGKTKKKCETLRKEIKKIYDRLYYEAFYDKRFQVCNYKHLLEDLDLLKKQKAHLIFVRIPNIIREYYNGEQKAEIQLKFINELKNIARNEDGMIFRKVYLVGEYLLLICGKEHCDYIYKKIAKLKLSDSHTQNYQMYHTKYTYTSVKSNKNLSECIKKVNVVFSGTPNVKRQLEKLEEGN